MAIQFSLILNLAISHKLLCVIFSSSVKSILKFPLWLFCLTFEFIGLPWWLRWLRVCLAMQEMQETQIWSWVGEIPWRRKWPPTPVYLPGKSYGQRSLVGCSPWPVQLDPTLQLNTHEFFFSSILLKFPNVRILYLPFVIDYWSRMLKEHTLSDSKTWDLL